MHVSIGAQTAEFLYACCVGVAIGALYSVLRWMTKRSRFTTVIGDLIFIIVSVAGATVFLLTVCGGNPRSFHVAGFLIGMAIWFTSRREVLAALRKWRKNG